MKVLNKPKHGWSSFKFDEENAKISYIDNFPYFVLTEMVDFYLGKANAFCVTLDAEGYEYTLLSYDGYTLEYILRKEKTVLKKIDMTFTNFVEGFIEDIEKNIEEWAIFPVGIGLIESDNIEDNLPKYVEEIKGKIKIIRNELADL